MVSASFAANSTVGASSSTIATTRPCAAAGVSGRRRRAQAVLAEADRVCLDERPHAVVLAWPFVKASAVGALGAALGLVGWPASVAGAVVLAVAAAIALRAAWRWERTRLLVTTESLVVVHGTLRRRSASVRLSRIGPVELEQTLLGPAARLRDAWSRASSRSRTCRGRSRVAGLVDRLARR